MQTKRTSMHLKNNSLHGSQVNSSSESEQSDAPRFAQWVDDEELDEELDGRSSCSSSDIDHDEGSSNPAALRRDLTTLPLGTLAKAQKFIETASRDPEDTDSDDSETSHDSEIATPGVTREVVDMAGKPRNPIKHRSNKHAPAEVTSKRPVPRRRQVVEIHKVQPRDPRFSELSGSLSANHYRSQYGFLSELHVDEMSTLKQSLTRAQKLLISSPRDLREAREEEVKRLELAVKRAESTVSREKLEEAEHRVLKNVHLEEKGKRMAGKKSWWLKDSEKKAVRVRARMDVIAASGGKRAVKKAIEKKQRKIAQKEKKSRPFAPPQKRPRDEAGIQELRSKRRRRNG